MINKKIKALFAAAALFCASLTVYLPAVTAADNSVGGKPTVDLKKARVSVHDPSVVKNEQTGMYYIFGSHIEAAKSQNLQSWTSFANGYATQNNKIFGNLSDNLKKAFAWAGEDLGDCVGGFAVWAPDVVWNPDFVNPDGSKGAYLMYFCTSSDYRTSVIAYASSKNIEGPYTFVNTLIYSGFTDTTVMATSSTKNVNRRYSNTNVQELIDAGQVTFNNQWFNNHNFNNQLFPNAIDPNIYFDTDGKMYMCYGSWSGGIFTLELDKTTGKCIHPKSGQTADGRMIDSYFGTKISGGYGKSGEGPFIEYNADTGYYYLWVTYGGLTSTGGYNMRVGRSKSPLGPFKDPSGKDMVLTANPNLNAVGLKVMTNYKFSSLQKAYMAPGHNSVLRDDDGQWYLVNHTRFDDGAEFHEVRVHTMNFNEAGWPVVMPYEYSGEQWSKKGYEPSALAGSYEFINHGTGTDGKITTAQKITLNADGSISGAVSGKWTESDDTAAATFTIGNVSYQGFFNTQYDETGTGKQVMTFTAVGNDNQSIWGVGTDAWNGSERDVTFNHIGSGTLVYDKNAVADNSGKVYIGDSGLLSNVPYTITNVNSGLVLESVPDDMTDGTGIQQWNKRGNKSGDRNQDFRLTEVGGGYCRITSMVNEDYCVTVKGNTAEDGLEIDFEKYTGADNQKWKLVKSGSYFGIVAKSANDAAGLDVYEWSKENGGAIKQWEFWGGECQLWKITPTYAMVPAHSYTIRNLHTGQFVGADGSKVTQSTPETAWIFKMHDDSYFTISDADGNCLTASDGNAPAALSVEPFTGKDNQKFKTFCNADGSYGLISKSTELGIGFITTAEGDQLMQIKYTGTAGDSFVLSPAAEPKPKETETTTTTTTTETTTTSTTTTVTETTTTSSDTSETTTVTTAKEKVHLGDVNCDTKVDVSDAVLLARFVAEDAGAEVSAQGKKNADCDQDGQPASEDVILILKHIAKLITLPEAE